MVDRASRRRFVASARCQATDLARSFGGGVGAGDGIDEDIVYWKVLCGSGRCIRNSVSRTDSSTGVV